MPQGGDDRTAGAFLVSSMWWYAAAVLEPARSLKRAGLSVCSEFIGDLPESLPETGMGPRFSKECPGPVLLTSKTEHDTLVEEFDRMAEVYAEFVRPFSQPIFSEALPFISRWLPRNARVLDAGCGPGREALEVARRTPEGEVIGIDLAKGMVVSAHRAARAGGLDNCAFFQSDVGELPEIFNGQFDLAYSCLAHHHYPDARAATAAILRCLRPCGVYCVVDPGPAWYNELSAPIAKWADPGWIGFHTPEQFRSLFQSAGYARTGWQELLPGFGVAVGQKARA
jgi:ubiquinone/menaquinone biosynthesis C-methylase UbiE